MWTKHQSYILLIHFKKQPRVHFMIPLALPVFEATLASLQESLEVWESFFPNFFNRLTAKHNKQNKQLKPSLLLSKCILLIRELRKYKSFDLLHIDDGKIMISIRLI